jgi:hypothetical protein
MSIANTTLPDDFVEKVLQCADASKHTLRDAVDEAILAVLHRPLTSEEKWAIIDHMGTNASAANLARAVFKRVTGAGRQ